MDWRSARFDWNCARAFLVTAEEGSLSAAARALGVAQPTLSRQVAALEHELRVALFERVGRGLVLTDAGARLLEHVRSMGAAARRVSLSTSGEVEVVTGSVCIAASHFMAAFVLPALLVRVRAKHPSLEVKLVTADEPREWRRCRAELVLASELPAESRLVAERLRELALGLYVAPAHAKELGPHRNARELGAVQVLGVHHDAALSRALAAAGVRPAASHQPLETENSLVAWELVKWGLGVGVVPEEVGDADANVERLLPELSLTLPCFALSQPLAQRSASARAVLELVVAELG